MQFITFITTKILKKRFHRPLLCAIPSGEHKSSGFVGVIAMCEMLMGTAVILYFLFYLWLCCCKHFYIWQNEWTVVLSRIIEFKQHEKVVLWFYSGGWASVFIPAIRNEFFCKYGLSYLSVVILPVLSLLYVSNFTEEINIWSSHSRISIEHADSFLFDYTNAHMLLHHYLNTNWNMQFWVSLFNLLVCPKF